MLVGRERERRALRELQANARCGRSSVLALVGEPGIGKTALLEDAAECATGMRVLRARGIESETHVPFAGLLELLRPALRLTASIPAPQARALEAALALRPGVAAERFAVGAATLSLLGAFAEEMPVLLLIDDVHLLDGSTGEALRFALRRLLAEPIAAILTAREGEPSLLDDADLPVMRLGGLARDAADQLLGELDVDVAARVYRGTGGNPLALLELGPESFAPGAAAIDAPVSVSAKLARAFLRRADTLDEDARKLLVLAATCDSDDMILLARAGAGLGMDMSSLDALEASGLVRVTAGHITFRHPLARAAVYIEASADERRSAHRAVARALPDRDGDRRAWHLAAAAVGVDDSTSSLLEQAGIRARERSAYAVASAAFERAAQLAQHDQRAGRLLVAAADSAWLGGLADRATDLLDRARRRVADPDRTVEIEHLRGRIAVRRGPVMEGYAILVGAAGRAAAESTDLAIDILAEAVDACFFAGDVEAMRAASDRIADLLAPDASPRTRFVAAMSEGMASVFADDGRKGIESIRAAVALAEREPELRSDARLLPLLLVGPLWLREADSGRAFIEESITTARAQAALGMLPWLLNRVGRDHAAAREWQRAAVEYDEAMRLARESGQHTEHAAALAGMSWLEARLGRESECRTHADEARALCARLGVGIYDVWAIRALGELELGLGRVTSAIEHLESCQRRLDEMGVRDVDLAPAAELVDAYLRVGRTSDAEAVAARFDAAAVKKAQPWPLARAARCRGLLAPDAEFSAHFERALELHAQTPDVFEAGVTRLALGARLRRGRRRVQARTELRAALQIFDQLGAAPWSELARTELLATGEEARRRDFSMLDSLTRQELHIAHVLATGTTTREAAAALFLSPKTIEYHLRSVYRKLGVNTRDALAAALESL